MVTIKAMSFNTSGGLTSGTDPSNWAARAQLIVNTILKHDPDVIGLQEAQDGNLNYYCKETTEYLVSRGPRTITQSAVEALYNPILWKAERFKLLASGGFYLSKTKDVWSKSWDSTEVRCANWVILCDLANHTSCLLLNTHLDHLSERARVESAKLILDVTSRLRRKNHLPAIVMGDFNSRPWAPPREESLTYPPIILRHRLPNAGTVHNLFMCAGFTDTYLNAGNVNKLCMNTYHSFLGEGFPLVAMRIDWILTSPGIRGLNTEDFIIAKDALPPLYPSDHCPVIAEISWGLAP